MNKVLDTFLVKRFPKLYQDRYKPMNQTCMCWGFDCGDGWFPIVFELSEKIEELNNKYKNPIVAVQVKEKFGMLRFYTNFHDDEVEKWIEEAERKSGKTCEVCGEPGKQADDGWITTLCSNHRKERTEYKKKANKELSEIMKKQKESVTTKK